MKILSLTERRDSLFSLFIEKLKSLIEKRRAEINKRASDSAFDAFEKFCDGIVKLSRGISDFSKTIITKLKFENSTPAQTTAQIAFANALALGSAEAAIINKVLPKQREALITKFTQARDATNYDFIGPLPESFELARRHNDLSGLRKEFAEYSQFFARHDKALEFENLAQGGFKVIFRSISEPKPASDGMLQRAVRQLRYYWSAPPLQTLKPLWRFFPSP